MKNRTTLLLTAFLAVFILSCNSSDEAIQSALSNYQKENNMEKTQLKEITQKFYDALSTTPDDGTAAATSAWMATDWHSTPTPAGGAGLEGFVKTLHMFHGMIPDLNWDVKEMLVDGDQVVVRSIATGTPNSPEGYFFGTPTNGSKKFEVQTIDIHKIENGKFVKSFHVEDWLTAVQQVSGGE